MTNAASNAICQKLGFEKIGEQDFPLPWAPDMVLRSTTGGSICGLLEPPLRGYGSARHPGPTGHRAFGARHEPAGGETANTATIISAAP